MSGSSFSQVPANPRLEFGVPLDEVCPKGILHPGLRELFLKAYLSANGDDHAFKEQFKRKSKIPYVLKALKAGLGGQGQLEDRISLKLKLESGKWIIATQTPAGAPLWLLRHFLGCLPKPLLPGSHWRMMAYACGAVSCFRDDHPEGEVLEKLVLALEDLPKENYSVLVALVLLIRNLSSVTANNDSNSMTLHEDAVEVLSQYFTAAIISRPYRPGLFTMLDKEHKPLLVFLAGHWLEVKELCRHAGISRNHSTCESRYEFVSPDGEVNHTVQQAMSTAANFSYDKIDVPGSFTRKVNQQSPGIMNPHSSVSHSATENARIWRREVDETVTQNIQKIESPGDSVTVQTPKGVYIISPDTITSITNKEATGKVMEDLLDDGVELADLFDADQFQLDVQKIDDFECLLLRKLAKDKIRKNLTFDVRKLISKYEHEAMVFSRMHQAFMYDSLPPEKGVTDTVKVKVNGTQTFECEFSEESQSIDIEKLKERTNDVQLSSARVEILKNRNIPQILEEDITVVRIGLLEIPKFSKARYNKKMALIPLTKSTAFLIKNLTSDQDIVYPSSTEVTRFDSTEFPEAKPINEAMPNEDVLVAKVNKNVKTLTNLFEDTNKWQNQEKSNDFVTELKSNFNQGRRKPSDAKFSSHNNIVLADYASEQDIAKDAEQGFSKVVRMAKFLCEKPTNSQGLAESISSTQELFSKTSCAPNSSTNSI